MEKQKVLVAERISDKGVVCLKAEKALDVTVDFDIKREDLLQVIGNYDALIVRSVTKVNEELYDAAKKRFFVKFWGAKVSMHSWRGHALNTVRVLFRCVC